MYFWTNIFIFIAMENYFTSSSSVPSPPFNEKPVMSFNSIFNASYHLYRKVVVWQVVLLLVLLGVSYAFSLLAQQISGYDPVSSQELILKNANRTQNPFAILFDIPGYNSFLLLSAGFGLLLNPIIAGCLLLMHKANTNQSVQFSDLFIGYKKPIPYIVVGIAIRLISSLAMMLCVLPVLFVIPLFYTSLCFVLFEGQSASKALKSSFNLAKQNYGTVLAVSVLAFFASLAGVLICGVGILVTGMFYYATSYAVYIADRAVPENKI